MLENWYRVRIAAYRANYLQEKSQPLLCLLLDLLCMEATCFFSAISFSDIVLAEDLHSDFETGKQLRRGFSKLLPSSRILLHMTPSLRQGASSVSLMHE